MKNYKFEITYTVSTTVEVEAENEDAARQDAFSEAEHIPVGDMKEWSSEAELKSCTEKCENCCAEVDVDDVACIKEYRGIKLCDDCIEWAKQNKEDFEFIFAHKLNK